MSEVVNDANFIGMKPEKLYKMKKYNFETASGNLIVCKDSIKAPLKNLKIFGKSMQRTTAGAQLLPLVDIKYSANGINWECKDGIITARGETLKKVSGNEFDFYLVGTKVQYNKTDFTTGNVFVQVKELPPSVTLFVVKNDTGVVAALNNKLQKRQFVHNSGDEYRIMLRTVSESGTKIDISDLKIMFNQGNSYLPWEPYTGGKISPSPEYSQEIKTVGENGKIELEVKNEKDEKQIFPIQTENGLFGIPSNRGNFTDQNGKKWICDEIDFASGTRIKRIEAVKAHEKDMYFEDIPDTRFRRFRVKVLLEFNNAERRGEVLCKYFTNNTISNQHIEGICFTSNKELIIYFLKDGKKINVEEFKSWLSEHDVTFYCALKEPVVTQLTTEEIAEYKKLRTYKGTTTFVAETDMEVTYKKD